MKMLITSMLLFGTTSLFAQTCFKASTAIIVNGIAETGVICASSSKMEGEKLILDTPTIKVKTKTYKLSSYGSAASRICSELGYQYINYRVSDADEKGAKASVVSDRRTDELSVGQGYNNLILKKLICTNNPKEIY